MERSQDRKELLEFLGNVTRPGLSLEDAADDTNLIDAGFIDSFALIQIIFYLEQNHDLNLQALGIDPTSLNSVNGILNVIEQTRE